MTSIKSMVDNNQQVFFKWYRDGQMWYSTESGFEFPVPLTDVGTAQLKAQDKALLFMRYIRKYMDVLDKERASY